MPKVTLDMNTFKALASDTRLNILRALDGKKMNLKDICKATKLNKATLHEHLTKLNEAGLVKKKEREGHKWVYYKLTWKGEGLLHPENTRIVVMFSATFISLAIGIINILHYIRGQIVARAVNLVGSDSTLLYSTIEEEAGEINTLFHAVPETLDSSLYFQAPIANVPLANQTIDTLKTEVVNNLNARGFVGNSITPESLEFKAAADSVYGRINETYQYVVDNASKLKDVYNEGDGLVTGDAAEGVSELAAGVPSHMVAIAHDPAFQWIAVACIVIFGILLTVGVWRLWKNKKPKL